MAADVTLVAIPPGRYEVGGATYGPEEIVRVMNEDILFDDEVKVDLGDGWGYLDDVDYDNPATKRDEFRRWFWDQFHPNWSSGPTFDAHDVGPWSPMKQALGLEDAYGGNFLPGPTAAMYQAFVEGRWVNRGTPGYVGALMSRPLGPTFYKGKRWGNPGRRRKYAVQWIRQHIGDYVFTQSW